MLLLTICLKKPFLIFNEYYLKFLKSFEFYKTFKTNITPILSSNDKTVARGISFYIHFTKWI